MRISFLNFLYFGFFITYAELSFAMSEKRVALEKKRFSERTADIEILSWTDNSVVNLKFLGPENTEFYRWYEIKVELIPQYPFKPCSIELVGERPRHWFYFKYDNLSKKQDYGLFYRRWSPQITIVDAIDMIKDSLVHPEKYENDMVGQWDPNRDNL